MVGLIPFMEYNWGKCYPKIIRANYQYYEIALIKRRKKYATSNFKGLTKLSGKSG